MYDRQHAGIEEEDYLCPSELTGLDSERLNYSLSICRVFEHWWSK